MAAVKLSDTDIQKRLAELPAWALRAGKLYREFRFSDFSTAFGFMASAALVAERLNHHPEWSNVYNRVSVELMTHEAQGITENDFQLAQAMEKLGARLQK